ncbi:putative membrane protein YesL [Neobacillus niacini]|uniref:YesL family protein n=1 Tax=Neobacillus niacini TaxID=86668 RepID=UPI0028641217|nr:YesL family protein [Neobacillus niacini]MDR7078940.1 putative membrane protein YesL [Neobacillus niacini]
MPTNGTLGFIYKFSDWAMKLAYLNILWILFTIFGLIIGGFFPATFALFSVIRLLLQNREEASVFKTFWSFYKKDFWKSNSIGWSIILIFIIFYLDIQFVQESTNPFLHIFYYPLLILAFIFSLTVLYIIPTYIHFDLKMVQLFKNSFIIMILNPLNTITMISGVMIIYFVSMYIPGIIPFFGGSLLALFIMIAALRSYKKVEDKKEHIESVRFHQEFKK